MHQFILERGYSKRSFITVLLGNIHPPCWMRLVGLISETYNKVFYSQNTHLVDCFTIRARCHIALFSVNALIGGIEHLFIEQNAVQPFELVARNIAVFT